MEEGGADGVGAEGGVWYIESDETWLCRMWMRCGCDLEADLDIDGAGGEESCGTATH